MCNIYRLLNIHIPTHIPHTHICSNTIYRGWGNNYYHLNFESIRCRRKFVQPDLHSTKGVYAQSNQKNQLI